MPARRHVHACASAIAALLFVLPMFTSRVAAQPPTVSVWYGNTQAFGGIGNPVPDINILGNVGAPAGLASLTCTLNGGAPRTLSVGPDTRRLARPGDFNIDIPTASLAAGSNRLIITATDNLAAVDRETVMVNYVPDRIWPLPYSIDWSGAGSISSVAQVVDGKWRLEPGGLRMVETGYDRFVAVGDKFWSDYEITVPITVFSIDSNGFQYPSNGCGVGFLMRWPGHSDLPASLAGWQPRTGYLPLGALSWYEWTSTGSRGKITGNGISVVDQDSTGFQMQFNTEYMFRMRVETVPGVGGRYRMKIWQSGSPEPAAWLLDGQEETTDPQRGSLLLAAHNVDARFGNLTITPITTVVPSSVVSDDFSAPAINTQLWSLRDPLGDASFSLTGTYTPDARLTITVPAGTVHEPWTNGNGAVRAVQSVANGDFEVETKFESPLTARFQMQGIEVLRHDSTYIRFEFFSDGTATRVFAATLIDNLPATRLNAVIGPQGIAPLYMRIRRAGNGWTMMYSRDGSVWTVATTFPYTMETTGIGPYAGNTGVPAPAFTGLVDYFFNTAQPVVPEDSARFYAPVIVTNPSNASVAPGQTATFTVAASGTAPLSYQWKKNSADIAGATGPSYTTPPAVLADDGARFLCVVSNSGGSATSAEAVLSVVSAAGRVTNGLLALYTFEEGSGNIVHDVSGVSPALPLTIADPSRVTWHDGSLKMNRRTVIRSAGPATKIIAAARASNELTVEAWVTPAENGRAVNGDDDEAIGRIVSNAESQNIKRRNFSLDEEHGWYACRVRTTRTSNQVTPHVRTADGTVVGQLTHLLYTRNTDGTAIFYINGVEAARTLVPGTFQTWDAAYPLSVANEVSGNRPWYGSLHLAAIYRRALSPSEALQNFQAGADPDAGSDLLTAVPGTMMTPVDFALEQNYPNPFNPVAEIGYRIAERSHVTLTVYDMLGRPVATLVDDERAPGLYMVSFDGSQLASGTYLYRLTAGSFMQTRKMMLVK